MPSAEALFRYRVLSDVLSREQRGQPRPNAVAEVAAHPCFTTSGDLRTVTTRSIYRWLKAFGSEQNIGKLEPASRERTKSSIVIAKRLLDFVVAEKEQDIAASIPEILRRARQSGVIAQAECIDRTTLYRACLRLSIPVFRRRKGHLRDSRRFAYPHRMQLALSDGKHFRAGITRARRVAMFFLDDCSRFGLHVVVGTSECAELFLRGLHGSIGKHGLADGYFFDNGGAFSCEDTTAVMQQLPALLIHGEKAYPEGHGKIERFHLTAINACLRNLDNRPDVDPDCGALELRINHWLCETYNHTPHESLDGQTPWARFSNDAKQLRFPESMAKLREKFLVQLRRKVSNDHTVSIDAVAFETPRGLAGSWIMTYRQVLDGTIYIIHDDRFLKIHPVDLAANALTRRSKENHIPADGNQPLPKSAADMAFEKDFHPIVDGSGNFNDPKQKGLTLD